MVDLTLAIAKQLIGNTAVLRTRDVHFNHERLAKSNPRRHSKIGDTVVDGGFCPRYAKIEWNVRVLEQG